MQDTRLVEQVRRRNGEGGMDGKDEEGRREREAGKRRQRIRGGEGGAGWS